MLLDKFKRDISDLPVKPQVIAVLTYALGTLENTGYQGN